MSSPESKELLKLFKCSTDIATLVVSAFADIKLLQPYAIDFQKYLEDNKHFFYHQWEQKNTACCHCPPAGCHIRRITRMDNWIFNSFYNDNGIVYGPHILKQGGTIQQKCIHRYVARNISLDHLDITILCFVLLNSGKLIGPEKIAIETIINKRNSICHAWSTHCLTMVQLYDIWSDIESAVFALTHPFLMPIFKSQIQASRKYDFEREEIQSLSTKLDKLNASLEELRSRIQTNNNINTTNPNIEDRLMQLSQQSSEDIKQHISQSASNFASQTQQALSQEIKEIKEVLRKGIKESFKHMIENHIFKVKYDRPDNVLVPEEKCEVLYSRNDLHSCSQECRVRWDLTSPKEWDLEEAVANLKDPSVQDGDVKIKDAKKGSLVIMTTIAASILNDREAFESTVRSFLNKIVEVCQINTKIHAQVDVSLHIFNPNEEENIPCTICCELGEQSLAAYYCLDCEHPEPLCLSCADEHKVMKRTKDHQLSTAIYELSKSHCLDMVHTDYSKSPYPKQKENFQERFDDESPSRSVKMARRPGQPYASDVVNKSDHINLKWEYDGKLRVEEVYQIMMKQHPGGRWKIFKTLTSCIKPFVTVDCVKPETTYVFKVRVVNETTGEEGLWSPESDVITTSESPATWIMKKSTKLNNDTPAVYKLPIQEIQQAKNAESHTKRFILGNQGDTTKEKTIMIVGATGSGKTTLIDAMTNYVIGVTWEDPFRFTLIQLETCEQERVSIQALSQTDGITCYTLCSDVTSRIDYTINFIDTPGFGDTRGLQQDAKIVSQIRDLFRAQNTNAIAALDAVCFILKSPDARLTTTQKYIFESILALFGNDMKDNIWTFVTFADGSKPPVLAALKELDGNPLPFDKYFSFNNSALFISNREDNQEMISPFFWKMGMKSCGDFFRNLRGFQPQSLILTSEVLTKRQTLENTILHLQEEIDFGFSKINLLEQEVNILTKYKHEIRDNKNFEFEVEESKMETVDTSGQGLYTTTCLICKCICHNNCKCACTNNSNVENCCAIGSDGYCSECPEHCHWNQHSKVPYIFKLTTQKVRKTYVEMKYRYQQAHQKMLSQEEVLEEIYEDIEVLEFGIQLKLEEITEHDNRLKEIALRPSLISSIQYIELMIETEFLEKKSGFVKRVETLQQCKRRAEIGKTFQILKHRLQNARATKEASTWANQALAYDRDDRNMFKKANDKFKQLIYDIVCNKIV